MAAQPGDSNPTHTALSFFRPTSAMEHKRRREEPKLPPTSSMAAATQPQLPSTSSMATAANESLPKKEMNVRSNAWHPYYWKEWVKYASDRFVLSCVKGIPPQSY